MPSFLKWGILYGNWPGLVRCCCICKIEQFTKGKAYDTIVAVYEWRQVHMGIYLNSKKAALLYQKETRALYFVDKTLLVMQGKNLWQGCKHYTQGSNGSLCKTG